MYTFIIDIFNNGNMGILKNDGMAHIRLAHEQPRMGCRNPYCWYNNFIFLPNSIGMAIKK